MSTIWAFDLGKSSIGEAVWDEDKKKFLHVASLLIPPDFASTKKVATRQRTARVTQQKTAIFDGYWSEAREILNDLLGKYTSDVEFQFTLLDVLKVPSISQHGNVNEITGRFCAVEELRNGINELHLLQYAA